jgi:hypothetical protein
LFFHQTRTRLLHVSVLIWQKKQNLALNAQLAAFILESIPVRVFRPGWIPAKIWPNDLGMHAAI